MADLTTLFPSPNTQNANLGVEVSACHVWGYPYCSGATSAWEVSGDYINASSGTLGGGSINVTGTLTNNGQMTGGGLTVSGTFNNNSKIQWQSGGITINSGGIWNNTSGGVNYNSDDVFAIKPGGKVINGTSSGGQWSANMNISEMQITGGETTPGGGTGDIFLLPPLTLSPKPETNFVNYGNIWALDYNPGDHVISLSSTIFENHGLLTFNNAINLWKKAQLVNYGTIDGSGTGVISSNVLNKIVNTLEGLIVGAPTFVNKEGGIVKGVKSIGCRFVDNGTLSPGNSPGGMTISGDLIKRGGMTHIELGGHSNLNLVPSDHPNDSISVAGSAKIGGRLKVSRIHGFKVSANDRFVIKHVDGNLKGAYEGLPEGSQVGLFRSITGKRVPLYITYKGGDGNDVELLANPLDVQIHNRVIGRNSNDRLTGSKSHDLMHGRAGNDVLKGKAGSDLITGGDGDDVIFGGAGDDVLKGDRGADTYVISKGSDVIHSFSSLEGDKIKLEDPRGLEVSDSKRGVLIKGEDVHTVINGASLADVMHSLI